MSFDILNLLQIEGVNAFFNKMNLGVIIVDEKGLVVDFNEVFLAQKGLTLNKGFLKGVSSEVSKGPYNHLLPVGSVENSKLGLWKSLKQLSTWSGLHLDYNFEGQFNLQGALAHTIELNGKAFHVLYSQRLNNLLLGTDVDYSMWAWGHDLNNISTIIGNVVETYFINSSSDTLIEIESLAEDISDKLAWLKLGHSKLRNGENVGESQFEMDKLWEEHSFNALLNYKDKSSYDLKSIWGTIIKELPFAFAVIDNNKSEVIFRNQKFNEVYSSNVIDSMKFNDVNGTVTLKMKKTSQDEIVLSVYTPEDKRYSIIFRPLSTQFVSFAQDINTNLIRIRELATKISIETGLTHLNL